MHPLLPPRHAPSPPTLRRTTAVRLGAASAPLGSTRTGWEFAVHSGAVAHDPTHVAPPVDEEEAGHAWSHAGCAPFAATASSAEIRYPINDKDDRITGDRRDNHTSLEIEVHVFGRLRAARQRIALGGWLERLRKIGDAAGNESCLAGVAYARAA